MAFSYYSRPRHHPHSPPLPAPQIPPADGPISLPLPLDSHPYPAHNYAHAAQPPHQGYIYRDPSPTYHHQPPIPSPHAAMGHHVNNPHNSWSTSSSPRFQPFPGRARQSHSPSSAYLGSPQTGYHPQLAHSQQPSPHIQPLADSSPHPSSAHPSPPAPAYLQSAPAPAPAGYEHSSMPEVMPFSAAGYGAVNDGVYDGAPSFSGYVDTNNPAPVGAPEDKSWENSARDVAPDDYAQALALYTHICSSLPYYIPTSQPTPTSSVSTPPTTFDSIINLASEGHSLLSGSGQAPPSGASGAVDPYFGPSSSAPGAPGFDSSNVESPEGRIIGGGIASGSAALSSGVTTPAPAPGPAAVPRKRRNSGRKEHSGPPPTCLGCGATETPEWRRGPMGPRTLCNACGLVHMKLQRKKRKAEEKERAAATAAA